MTEVRFDGQAAIVTGAGKAVGRAHARLLAARGAKVVVSTGNTHKDAGKNAADAQAVVDEIKAAGGIAVADTASIVEQSSATSIVQAALDAFGRIDIVVNNAGSNNHKHAFENYPATSLAEDLSVHLLGTWNVTQAAWPHMKRQRHGRVLTALSFAGLYGLPGAAGYCTAKGALLGFTRSLSQESKQHGIHINALVPSAASGKPPDPNEKSGWRGQNVYDQDINAWRTANQTPEMVAAAALWLLHRDCPANGEIFGCFSGRLSSIFLGDTDGFWTEPHAITPEAVRDNFAQVSDRRRYHVPTSVPTAITNGYRVMNIPGAPSQAAMESALNKSS